MVEQCFYSSKLDTSHVKEGSFSWRVPSNIALVKYWGKSEPQIPKNPSLSFTLSKCHTETTLRFKLRDLEPQGMEKAVGKPGFEVYFEGKRNASFEPKIASFFERILKYVPFISDYQFEIHSKNSFPHSSGIASSASGMGALAMNIMSLEKRLNPMIDMDYFWRKASFLARLGSGSACRSIEGGLIVWGQHEKVPESSDLFGIQLPFHVHENFNKYQDTVLLIDEGKKEVSSTQGHNLMHNHPFAESRFEQANSNMSRLITAMTQGDLESFVEIVESEALSLHAMMLTSTPSYVLMRPNTLRVLEEIRKFRRETGSNVCFTLDAGANVHVLYPYHEKEIINNFIVNKLSRYCKENRYICDEVGTGAEELKKQ